MGWNETIQEMHDTDAWLERMATGGPVVGEQLDIAAREAIERANGGPVYMGAEAGLNQPAEYLDTQAVMRVLGKISLGEADRDAGDVAHTTNLRQAASETPAAFVKRITVALLKQMAGVE